ncbi:MAG TPA: RDD family protein [Usitatibacter sp.]|nr:RDD family protein [Usitatibacter sp.]
MSGEAARRAPGLGRRLASALYDLLLAVALAIVATIPFLLAFGDSTHGWRRHILQAWVFAVLGAYYAWFWSHGGQTLPMKTWRIRLVRSEDGGPVNPGRAAHRYVLAALGLAAAGLGFAWALFDRDNQFLHDRLSGTALVDAR